MIYYRRVAVKTRIRPSDTRDIQTHHLLLVPLTALKLMAKALTRHDNKVRELIVVKVFHTSLLNTTVVAFKVLPLGSVGRVA